ncbi:uncharacterized protein [Penaeus vannamei]|uniref:uncharacterized protein n=1 Tax=Penaeus vannamei TaxID=6689 RepID=UPI00387F8569
MVCSNHRGITLLSIPGKVLAQILLRHIRDHLLRHQRPEQSGFTPSAVISGLLAPYIDLKKAFDTVHRESLHQHLSVLAGDWILGRATVPSHCGATLVNIKVTDLDFADDIAILSESLVTLVVALDALSNEAKSLGLEVSWTKTKILDFGDLLGEPVRSACAYGEEIEVKESFT